MARRAFDEGSENHVGANFLCLRHVRVVEDLVLVREGWELET